MEFIVYSEVTLSFYNGCRFRYVDKGSIQLQGEKMEKRQIKDQKLVLSSASAERSFSFYATEDLQFILYSLERAYHVYVDPTAYYLGGAPNPFCLHQ